ncbi:amidohydrolase [Flavobacterium sp. GT3R68]|uniref:amidohydrolase n=1 Tax=Flavobacterium sp. GT3R68 TaxID=2594437 RepID=UPI000F88CB97|nr:amidohydrolase [Flavobacterium sp. GT3R68]RTY95757.1 amidohydrolase [Flavobacterium sp. GSN2]TRW93528.1 amidohydrolase [Flavobacterium sp. GT3R68]
MNIAIIQAPLQWENPSANRNYFADKINAMHRNADLIVLPEMFTTGFTMNPNAIAETMEGETVQWLRNLAEKHNIAITGSIIIKENNCFYNRLLFVFPSGEIQHYDKRHLFTLAGEDKVYTAGTKKLIVDYLGWKICPLVCYDLRFPVFSRNTENYDVLIYVANWPEPRISAWDALLKARAIENMCYVVGVNRISADHNKHNYPGHSQMVNYLGKHMIDPTQQEGVLMATLDMHSLIETREKLGFLDDQDSFTIN